MAKRTLPISKFRFRIPGPRWIKFWDTSLKFITVVGRKPAKGKKKIKKSAEKQA